MTTEPASPRARLAAKLADTAEAIRQADQSAGTVALDQSRRRSGVAH